MRDKNKKKVKKKNDINKVSAEKGQSSKIKKKRHNFLYVLIMGGLLFVGISAIYMQYNHTLELNKKNDELISQIEEQHKMTEKIKNQENSYDNDEYVEKIAREQLSLVKPNEILFVDINK